MTPTAAHYQLVVIGSGPGGADAALLAARQGFARVLLVEKDSIGGGALRGGVVPVRSLLSSQRLLRQLRSMAGRQGFESLDQKAAEGDGEDEKQLVGWIHRQRHLVARMTYQQEETLRQAGVEIVHGHARLLGGGRLQISHPAHLDEDGREVQADQIILATGSRPGPPDKDTGPSGEMNADVGTSRRFVSLAEPPRSLIIVGGGNIGCEFASIYNALGTRVTLIEKRARLLSEMDPEAGEHLAAEFSRRGIRVRLDREADVQWNSETGGLHHVRLLPGDDEIVAGKVLLATGRVPNVAGLGLEAAGVQFDPIQGIKVNEFLQTSVPGIAAIGDVNGLCMLSDSARAQARVAVENARGRLVPYAVRETLRCVHTDPAVAVIGLTEDQATAEGRPVRVATASFPCAVGADYPSGLVKLIVDRRTHWLLGGMIVAENAPEWIGELSVALRLDAPVETFAVAPRANEVLGEAIQSCLDRMFGEVPARGMHRLPPRHAVA